MIRKTAVFAIALAVFAPAFVAHAQPAKKVHRIGFLAAGSAESFEVRLAAFRQGLRELGYLPGDNIVIEERYAAGRRKRLPALATDLVGLGTDLIVTHGASSTSAADRAAKEAGRDLPVVFALDPDPVGARLVASLARPGGNVTGLSNANSVLVPKRLELLKEVVPAASRIAVLWSPLTRNGARELNALHAVAPRLSVTIVPVTFSKPSDLEGALAEIGRRRAEALDVLGYSQASTHRRRIVAFALENRLPAIYPSPQWTKAGGLMSYGTDIPDLYRRAAAYVDKILKGAKPADLPVEQPTKFTLEHFPIIPGHSLS
jgi:putative ABC transport system substrate-binding protein